MFAHSIHIHIYTHIRVQISTCIIYCIRTTNLHRSAVAYETRRSGPQPFVCSRGRYSACTYENENIIICAYIVPTYVCVCVYVIYE